VIGDPLVYVFVSQSVTLATVLTHSPDGAMHCNAAITTFVWHVTMLMLRIIMQFLHLANHNNWL